MSKSDRAAGKRKKTVDAARFLVLRDGLRGTTMEAIALEAGIAKPTLYAQFPDKDAVFAAVFEALLAEIKEEANGGFLLEGKIWEQVGEVLARQYLAIKNILNGSPHGYELIMEPKRSGFQFEPRHFETETRIAEALTSSGLGDATSLTRIISACAYGIFLKTEDPKAMASGIRLVTERVIRAELS